MSASRAYNFDDLLANYARLVIMEALRKSNWNRRKAAEVLGISRRRLLYRLASLHVDLKAIPRDLPGRRRTAPGQKDLRSGGVA
jgi:DNA-binding NtrC family response regulator